MRLALLASLPLIAAGLAAPAIAEDTAPPSAFTITGGATLVSDYRFRAISQSNKRVAIQGTLTVAHKSGFYGSIWSSSIDDYVVNGADAEVDLIAGYKKTVNGTTFDAGFLYYYYPGAGGVNSDFFEPYANVSHTFGPVSAKAGVNLAWKQHALSYGAGAREGGVYGYGELSGGIPGTGLTLTGHLGRSFQKNYITFGTKYTDWSLTAAYTIKNLTLSAGYVDSNRDLYSVGPVRNVSKAGVVGSIGVAF